NAAIAGHRTTYGAPLYHLDELRRGDEILVTTRQGHFRFQVDDPRVVKPSDVSVLNQLPGAHLTLTTCTPRFSASNRLVVTAELVGDPAPPPPQTITVRTVVPGATESLSGKRSAAWPTIVWGAAAALVALLVWLASRRGWRWLAYLLGAPIFLAVLF